jgi:hypothetical protein
MEGSKHDDNLIGGKEAYAFTYAYSGDYHTASSSLIKYSMEADSSGAPKERVSSAKLIYLTDCQRMAMQSGNAVEVKTCMAMTDPMNMDLANSIGTNEAKLNAQAMSHYWHSILSAMQVITMQQKLLQKTLSQLSNQSTIRTSSINIISPWDTFPTCRKIMLML